MKPNPNPAAEFETARRTSPLGTVASFVASLTVPLDSPPTRRVVLQTRASGVRTRAKFTAPCTPVEQSLQAHLLWFHRRFAFEVQCEERRDDSDRKAWRPENIPYPGAKVSHKCRCMDASWPREVVAEGRNFGTRLCVVLPGAFNSRNLAAAVAQSRINTASCDFENP